MVSLTIYKQYENQSYEKRMEKNAMEKNELVCGLERVILRK